MTEACGDISLCTYRTKKTVNIKVLGTLFNSQHFKLIGKIDFFVWLASSVINLMYMNHPFISGLLFPFLLEKYNFGVVLSYVILVLCFEIDSARMLKRLHMPKAKSMTATTVEKVHD